MTPFTHRLRRDWFGIAAALLFFLAGQPFIPLLGIQNDEALFAVPILAPRYGMCPFRIFHTHFALMLMSYLGTLKTLVLLPVIRTFGAGPWAVREPMLLAAAVSVWFFYLLVRRAAGERAARIGAALLAADGLYLLTACFDWGPVALQHLLLVTGMYLAARFYQERSGWSLAAAFFAFGLALWDKALATWMLSGMGIAAVAVFPREILGVISRRRLALAVGGLLLGALPLAIYNAANRMETFRGNFVYDDTEIPARARMLMHTADGGALLGYLNQEDAQTAAPHAPRGLLQRASSAVSTLAGHPRHSLFLYTAILAIALAPLVRGPRLRVLVFAVLAIALAWIQMAVTAGAGGSVHHTILLWPLPQMAVAAGLAAASERLGRWGLVLLTAVAVSCASSAAVTNEYHAQMVRNGASVTWTDAVFGLNRYLKNAHAKYVFCMDWGYLDTLRLLGLGKLPLREGSEVISRPELSPADRAYVLGMVSDPQHLFVTHPNAIAVFPTNDPKLARFAEQSGYRRETVAVIPDSFDRPTFEIYRFRTAPASLPPETKRLP